MVIERLQHLGYTAEESDYAHIEFEMQEVINYALIYCNITEIPEIVEPRLIDRICSYFLFYKKNAGALKSFNYDAVIKQIKEGDTTVQYAVGQGEDTPENRFDNFVRKLELTLDKWLTPYRRLRW
jgi:hypothetical protein